MKKARKWAIFALARLGTLDWGQANQGRRLLTAARNLGRAKPTSSLPRSIREDTGSMDARPENAEHGELVAADLVTFTELEIPP